MLFHSCSVLLCSGTKTLSEHRHRRDERICRQVWREHMLVIKLLNQFFSLSFCDDLPISFARIVSQLLQLMWYTSLFVLAPPFLLRWLRLFLNYSCLHNLIWFQTSLIYWLYRWFHVIEFEEFRSGSSYMTYLNACFYFLMTVSSIRVAEYLLCLLLSLRYSLHYWNVCLSWRLVTVSETNLIWWFTF